MLNELKTLLDDLSVQADAAGQERVEDLHRSALSWKPVDRLPVVLSRPLPEDAEHVPFSQEEALSDPEKMLFNELLCAFNQSIFYNDRIGGDLPWTIRPNFGTVLTASVYGAEVDQLNDDPPWANHFEGRADFERALDRNPDEVDCGWVPRVVEFYEAYLQILKPYPELRDVLTIVLPDLQGPLDNAAMLRGSDLLFELLEDPDYTDRALEKMARTQLALARRFKPFLTERGDGFSHQHGFVVPGNILIRCDSSVMLSPDVYRERVMPFDAQVLAGMEGGSIHSCGRFEQVIPEMLKIPDLKGIDFGQSYMNGLNVVVPLVQARGVALTRVMLRDEWADLENVQRAFPTGISCLLLTETPEAIR